MLPTNFRLPLSKDCTVAKPYTYPILHSFTKPKMIAAARAELRSIRKDLKQKRAHFKEYAHWLRLRSGEKKKHTNSDLAWKPKLYICVSPQNYWTAIRRLITLSEKISLNWKFCRKTSSLSRPDKIVIYFESISQIKKDLPKIRNALTGLRFHGLSHASLTSEMGFEKKGKGIYFGADPAFLKTASWRLYRCVVSASIEFNRDYFAEIAAKKRSSPYELFNLSSKHDGPNKLTSSSSQVAFIKKHWDLFY